MSIVRRIIKNNIERLKVDELLAKEYEQAGYGGITLTKTPMGAQINLYAMRPGRVIGKRGRAIKAASERLEKELGLPNPQITVIEVEVPELNPAIMAARIANALERGVHFRRSIFWSLRRIMDSGALGCEIILKGPLRSARSRFEKVVEGYVPKSGEPALRNVKKATIHVKMKRGTLGVTVKIVPPDAKFPDKISLDGLPDIEYQLPMEEAAPVAEVSAEAVVEESAPVEPAVEEPAAEEVAEAVEEAVDEPVVDESVTEEVAAEVPIEAEEPEAAEAVVEEEAAVKAAVDEPVVDESIAEEAAVEEVTEAAEPVVEEEAVEEPAVEKAVAEVAEEPVAKEPAVERPEAEVAEAPVAEEPAVEEKIEAAEPAVAEEVVEEEAPVPEETPVGEPAVEPVVEESPPEEAVEVEPEAVEEPKAEPVITESALEVSEPELVSEPEPVAEEEVVEPEPKVKPKPEADMAEETTDDQPEEEKQ